MKAVTIRGVEEEVADKLKLTAAKQRKSINQLVLEMVKEGLGLKKEKKFSREYDDLDHLFGRWSDNEFKEIDTKINEERHVDEELWR
ncbi:toxin-antitoxin system, antitoxin component, ribbon-helix-helix domain protein [delta proteobacterium NaphS2]|nr:toxin-antitoxin system, antitoxin component, ribbon-helix-helix domain protein [delta proteobacterium NaphS2]